MQAILLLVHTASTLFMTGLIWTIQVVHYPLFSGVGGEGFRAYHSAHSQWISVLVMPAMVVELIAACALIPMRPAAVPVWAVWLGAGLVGSVWLSTIALQVPAHSALGAGFDAEAHSALVQTNWVRTVCWSARSGLALWFVALLLDPDRF